MKDINETSVGQRIREVIKETGCSSISAFAKKIRVAQPTLNHCVNDNTEPRMTLLSAILSGLPSLSAEWLMRGEGPMMRGAPSPPPEPLGGADDEVVRLRAENAVLREQLARTQEMLMGAIGGRKE